jgi:hypothetical protein
MPANCAYPCAVSALGNTMPRRMRSAEMRPPIPSKDGPMGGPDPSIA